MSRRRRILFSVSILAACVCIALGVLAMLPPRPGVTKANFDRIEKGMSRAKVREIFGEKAIMWVELTSHPETMTERWTDESAAAWIVYHFNDDAVMRMSWVEPAFTDKLRRWLWLPASD